MRISDDSSDKKLDRVTIFLTDMEAMQLASYLSQIPEKPKGWHFHLSSEDYKKEITVCVYDPDNIKMLHPRAQKLIEDDV